MLIKIGRQPSLQEAQVSCGDGGGDWGAAGCLILDLLHHLC